MLDTGHWQLSPTLLESWDSPPFGFIYEITNLQNGRKYIGKKQCWKTVKRPPLKGRKNRRHVSVETDWKTYTGSCNALNEDIKRARVEGSGSDASDLSGQFRFEILQWCDSKWEMAYEEARLQFERGVLLSGEYYNGIIHCRISKKS